MRDNPQITELLLTNGRRHSGRAKINLDSKVRCHLSDMGLTVTEAAEIAADRGARRRNLFSKLTMICGDLFSIYSPAMLFLNE